MELQLGLTLSSNPIAKEFDLNCYGCDQTEALGSDPLSRVGSCLSSESIGECNLKKRGFSEAFELQGKCVLPPQTLPLLLWDNNQPDGEDDYTELDKNSSTISSDGEEEGVVGWPPIKSWRKKLCHQNRSGGAAGNEGLTDNNYGGLNGNGSGGGGGCGSKSTYVKVKMEGVAIARKVDLSLHHSYQSLKYTLVALFGRGLENVEAYKLTYQDREGDWLLAGDVPWSSFIQSVQRLELLRSCD